MARAVAELRATGFDQYLGAQAPSRTEQTGEWTHYFFDPAERGALCLVGDEFQVSVREESSDQVLLYLQGGGACWDYVTRHVLGTAFDGPTYRDLILSVTGDLEARYPGRFERFFPLGSGHTVLLGPEFYTQTVNGTSLLEWTRAFLDDPSSWNDTVE